LYAGEDLLKMARPEVFSRIPHKGEPIVVSIKSSQVPDIQCNGGPQYCIIRDPLLKHVVISITIHASSYHIKQTNKKLESSFLIPVSGRAWISGIPPCVGKRRVLNGHVVVGIQLVYDT